VTAQRQEGRHIYLGFVGCRLNEAEIERLGRQFAAQGDRLVRNPAEADVVIVNTCAVTNEATRKSRQMIRQVNRASPAARIVVTGCYAQLWPHETARLPGVSQVIGNTDKDRLPMLIAPPAEKPLYEQEPLYRDPLPPGTLGRTRAFVKVQDGCDNRCTFCVTTLARGPAHSRPLEEIVQEVQLLLDMGYQEVVLTGVHLGSYGHDQGQCDGLRRLIEALLTRTGLPRLRLSSLEPWDLQPDFFDLWADRRLCPHLHLPLQSGCDATLRRMGRRTTQSSFAALAEVARMRIPDLALTTDLIAGFPGETEAEFEESLRFVESAGFARLHVFPYSARPGTAAARMPGHIPDTVKKERAARLTALSSRLWQEFQARHIGRTVEVLWESAHAATSDGLLWSGLTGNYLRVITTTPQMLGNTITSARLVSLTDKGLLAIAC
jgi:threonylcarbamoyladenosine tRNA methylthiotransferase MtaB